MEEQSKPDFALFYRGQASKYEEYYQAFLKKWNLESAEEVHVGPAFQAYMGYQNIVVKQHPRYLPVAMLPCTMLWSWIAGSLIQTVNKQNRIMKTGLCRICVNRAHKAQQRSSLTKMRPTLMRALLLRFSAKEWWTNWMPFEKHAMKSHLNFRMFAQARNKAGL